MNASTQRFIPLLEEAAPRRLRARARVTRLRALPVADREATPPALGAEAWPWHLVTPIHSADASAKDAVSSEWPLSRELDQEAQRQRASFVGDVIAAAARALWTAVLGAYRRYQRARAAHATYVALNELDDRSLRDLGFARDEIRSVAAEMAGETEHSRRLARPTYPPRPSLLELLLRR